METRKLFKPIALEKIRQAHKVFLKVAVWILIAEFVLGAILILSQTMDETIAKVMGTFLVVAVVLFVGVNNFIRIEKGNRVVQGFALGSFVANLVWALMAIMLMWGLVPWMWEEKVMGNCSRYDVNTIRSCTTVYHMTVAAKLMLCGLSVAAAGFWISNVLVIKETVKIVKPLKITAVICEVYCSLFAITVALAELSAFDNMVERWYILSGFAGLAFVATTLAAWIISRTNRKNEQKVVTSGEPERSMDEVRKVVDTAKTVKTEAELRAEIEEKVRREMIEKEVRARIEAERRATQIKKDVTAEEIIEMNFEAKS